MGDRDALVRDEAYRMWVDAGRPEGGDQHYWFEAEKQVAGQQAAASQKAVKAKRLLKPVETAKPASASKAAKPAAPAKVVAKNAGNSGVAPSAVTPSKGERVEVAPIRTPVRAPRKSAPKPK